jgi:hypothetical protein
VKENSLVVSATRHKWLIAAFMALNILDGITTRIGWTGLDASPLAMATFHNIYLYWAAKIGLAAFCITLLLWLNSQWRQAKWLFILAIIAFAGTCTWNLWSLQWGIL